MIRVHPMAGRPTGYYGVPQDVGATGNTWPIRYGGSTGYVGCFGMTRTDRDGNRTMHRGTDYLGEMGQPIYAPFDGKVTRSYRSDSFGVVIYIASTEFKVVDKTMTILAHLGCAFVAVNDEVEAGDVIGLLGRSGYRSQSIPTHLHIEIRLGGEGRPDAVDPELWLQGLATTFAREIET